MNCTNLQEYLDRYGPLVADRAGRRSSRCTSRPRMPWSNWT